jgi:dipeptidase E
MMQRCSFSEKIKLFLSAGKQYIGASAGAVVAGPNIEPVRDLDDIREAAAPTSTVGLGLVNFVVIPHQNQSGQDKITKIRKEFGGDYDLVPINDDQAVTVNHEGERDIVESIQSKE